jgi:hypothetical protein
MQSLPLHQSLIYIRATPDNWICEKCGTRKILRGSEDHLDRELFISTHRGCYLPKIKVTIDGVGNLDQCAIEEYRAGVDTQSPSV